MNILVLQTCARIAKPLMLLFSIFLLLRGHDEPGGGFVGGLMAAAGFCLHAIAFDERKALHSLRVPTRVLIGLGLFLAAGAGVWAMLLGDPFLTGQWGEFPLPLLGELKLSTVLLFDIGVYFVVLGITLMITMTLMEE